RIRKCNIKSFQSRRFPAIVPVAGRTKYASAVPSGVVSVRSDSVTATALATCGSTIQAPAPTSMPNCRTAPGVLVWPDIFGLRPAFRQMGKRLAESGYAVVVVNQFYRAKKLPIAANGANTPIPDLIPLAQALNETTHMTDAKAFVAWLDSQPSVA